MFLLIVDVRSLQALFGGTFDPMHYGHLKPVETLVNLIGLSQVVIMPNNMPPHRAQPEASDEQRQCMVELAIADRPLFSLDERKLKRDAASYTAQTLREWREEQGPDVPLAFTISQNSLLTFPFQYDCDMILSDTHLIVCRRPGYPLGMAQEKHQQQLEGHLTHSPNDLYSLPCGEVCLVEMPWSNISATLTRERLEKGEPCDDLIPAAALGYINQQGLYR